MRCASLIALSFCAACATRSPCTPVEQPYKITTTRNLDYHCFSDDETPADNVCGATIDECLTLRDHLGKRLCKDGAEISLTACAPVPQAYCYVHADDDERHFRASCHASLDTCQRSRKLMWGRYPISTECKLRRSGDPF